jgi:hypothetical protein
METENQVVVRRIYSRHLTQFISKLGITVVRHLRRLVRILGDYLAIYDGPEEQCRFNCLDALCVLMQQAWPRIPGHADAIMKSLVRLIHDMATDDTTTSRDVVDRLTQRALECVELLRQICPAFEQLDDEFFAGVSKRRIVGGEEITTSDR